MRYRAEIDGLRAVAVLPVLLFHAGIAPFSGGYVGVDVFFVISGYLITGIIRDEIRTGSFSVARFYERRARRILPALFAVCLACVIPAWLWMMPKEFEQFGASLIGAMAFASNFVFWQQSGYFELASELKPLLHTWSLAVEEQFYLAFPLLLLVLRRQSTDITALALSGLALASLALAQHWSTVAPEANFFLIPSRFWELALGALLALRERDTAMVSSAVAGALSIVGAGLIASSVFAFSDLTPYPSLWTLAPTTGAALVIAFATPRTMAGRLLACRPLVAIGLVSYSLYLWHQPLLAFARIRFPDGLSDGAMLFILLLCFPLAWLTWRFVEQPVRRRGAFAVRPLVISGAAVAALIVAIGVAGVATGGMPWRLDAGAREIAGFAKKRNALDRNCQAYDGRAIAPADACVFNEGAPRRAALIGDSHADALADAVAEGLRAHGFSLRQMTHAGCLPVPGYRRSDGADHCTPYNRAVGDFLQSRPDVEWVVVAARWTLGLEGERFDNGEGGREAGRPVAGIPADGEALGALYRDAVRFHLAHGRKVVLVYPIPEVGWDVPTLLARKAQLGRPQPQLSTSPALFQSRNRRAIEALDGLPDHPDLIRIRPDAILCDTLIPDRCAAAVDGTPLYRDDDHLSSPGARLLTQAIVAAMGERGWLRDSVATKGGRNSEEARWGGE